MNLSILLLAAALQGVGQEAPRAEAQSGSAKPGPAGLEVEWLVKLDDAIAAARKMPKGRVLIELIDEECGACERMEAIVIPSTSFFSFTRDKVPVRVLRSSEDGRRIVARFGVDTAPAWIVATPDLLLCGVQAGQVSQMEWIRTFVGLEKDWNEYQKKLASERADPSNADLVFDIAAETYKRGGNDVAEPRFRRLALDPKVNPSLREHSLAYLASIEMDAGRIDDAAAHMEALLKTGKDPLLKERAELTLADVDLARGRRDLAAKRLERFKKEHPWSPLVSDADALLQRLKAPDAERKEP